MKQVNNLPDRVQSIHNENANWIWEKNRWTDENCNKEIWNIKKHQAEILKLKEKPVQTLGECVRRRNKNSSMLQSQVHGGRGLWGASMFQEYEREVIHIPVL